VKGIDDFPVDNPAIGAGKLRTIIDGTFPLERIRGTHARSETLRACGKIVITTKED
jgi:NADPH:quinone reductase-like Zn-dependent oxidoreductase